MFSKIKKIIVWIQEEILVISSILMFTLIAIGAFMRYILKKDFYGLEEIVMLFAFWQYFIGTSYAGYEDSHIEADMISPYIKSFRFKKILAIIKYTLSLLLAALTTVWSAQFLLWYLETKPVTAIFRIPVAITHFPILIGFGLWTVFIVGHLIREIKTLKYMKVGDKK